MFSAVTFIAVKCGKQHPDTYSRQIQNGSFLRHSVQLCNWKPRRLSVSVLWSGLWCEKETGVEFWGFHFIKYIIYGAESTEISTSKYCHER